MSARLNLLNKENNPLSFSQFAKITEALAENAENVFGSCVTEITFMDHTRYKDRFMHVDDTIKKDSADKKITLLNAYDIWETSPIDWAEAKYVEVDIQPTLDDTNTSAWVHAEFKGNAPHMVTLYAQGGTDAQPKQILDAVRVAQAAMLAEDGSYANSNPATKIPSTDIVTRTIQTVREKLAF